jgi:L-ascorbate metabolism protein UlaG (beta-lactamase superfamily)
MSTSNTVGSSIAALFSSSRKIENRTKQFVTADSVRLSVLWVGHATMLIKIEDKYILTDPVFTKTVAFLSKRLVEPGIEPENIPLIDVVLISHLHADHLSLGSIEMIEKKINCLLVPEGGLVYIPFNEFKSDELKWWKTKSIEGIEITAVPALHNGMRYGLDYDWLPRAFTAYVIEYKGITIYFGGDTGYKKNTKIFKETRSKFPKIDLAILPISPIHPREYSSVRHSDAHDALIIAKELGAEKIIPMHYDTFAEAYDTLGEAESLMKNEMIKNGLSEKEVILLKIGEQRNIISR